MFRLSISLLLLHRIENLMYFFDDWCDHGKCVCCPFNWVDSIKNGTVNFESNCFDTPTKDVRFKHSGSHRRFYSLDFQRSGWIANDRRYVHFMILWFSERVIQQMVVLLWCFYVPISPIHFTPNAVRMIIQNVWCEYEFCACAQSINTTATTTTTIITTNIGNIELCTVYRPLFVRIA